MANTTYFKNTMHLFGAPYQFTKETDPRIPGLSTTIGRNYLQNILTNAPICTIVPGKGVFMKGETKKNKKAWASVLLDSNANTNIGDVVASMLQNSDASTTDGLRMYEFESDYTSYMNYVNVLCRTGAIFLGLGDTKPNLPGIGTKTLKSYDWRKYRPTTDAEEKMTNSIDTNAKGLLETLVQGAKNITTTLTSGSSEDTSNENIEQVLTNRNYVQFYVDPETGAQDNMNNSYNESQLASMFNQVTSTAKEIANLGGLLGADTKEMEKALSDATREAGSNLTSLLGSIAGENSAIANVSSKLVDFGGKSIAGYNLITPRTYASSEFSRSYSITVHLRAPYGTPFAWYMDIWVPLSHLLALSLPKQESANLYAAPFLVKAFIEGVLSVNLGAVTSCTVSKASQSMNANGLANEVDVTLTIEDLYNDLSISNSTSSLAFLSNSSLIDYIATNCGMSIIAPNYTKKLQLATSSIANQFTDIGTNVSSTIDENVYTFIQKVTAIHK